MYTYTEWRNTYIHPYTGLHVHVRSAGDPIFFCDPADNNSLQHAYAHTHTHTHTHTRTHTHTSMMATRSRQRAENIQSVFRHLVLTLAHCNMHMHIHTHAYMHTYRAGVTQTYIQCFNMYTHTYTCIHAHIQSGGYPNRYCAYIHKMFQYVCTYIHMHTCIYTEWR